MKTRPIADSQQPHQKWKQEWLAGHVLTLATLFGSTDDLKVEWY